jgi:site-specific DNA-cytosine methylase
VPIRKQEFYEGAALHLAARTGRVRSLRYEQPFFRFNETLAVMLKYSTGVRSPWAFTFKGRFLHPVRNRAITMREAALLQTFPRRYKFPVAAGKEAIALLIGNALPPEFIRRHALEIRRALKNGKVQRG